MGLEEQRDETDVFPFTPQGQGIRTLKCYSVGGRREWNVPVGWLMFARADHRAPGRLQEVQYTMLMDTPRKAASPRERSHFYSHSYRQMERS